MVLETLNMVTLCFPFLTAHEVSLSKEDGPLAVAKFYHQVAPAVSLKILQGPKPTLKDVLSRAVQQGPKAETISKKTT